jgi:hypothetical protein
VFLEFTLSDSPISCVSKTAFALDEKYNGIVLRVWCRSCNLNLNLYICTVACRNRSTNCTLIQMCVALCVSVRVRAFTGRITATPTINLKGVTRGPLTLRLKSNPHHAYSTLRAVELVEVYKPKCLTPGNSNNSVWFMGIDYVTPGSSNNSVLFIDYGLARPWTLCCEEGYFPKLLSSILNRE